MEDRPSEDENIDNLDFEEISDEELEEEARANRGKGLLHEFSKSQDVTFCFRKGEESSSMTLDKVLKTGLMAYCTLFTIEFIV